ncbi:8-oxo-dGTP pyrophosphatase MutT (NUDIX family) [Stackebrandtia albiflava]|uniref:8-oxo-dGTP pyrophosphatase MutT (NUDIX family) n=1 Tax=Stackebrandtia albiflava TaxID=406432 RepID=A0A562VAD4_9ACTN|nr:NUDIX domain-containing protein [Stackebrandtia albiflava]TWJ14849.1 8-oxo-dGTP pyrophosphatase MutT (NUDIX family) [Stackebrandtia albiflava]
MDVKVHERRAGRVLLLDRDGRVLLFRGCDPRHPDDKFWFTAGGGVEPGEDDARAACRELAEETGIPVAPADLTGPVHETTEEFWYDGRRYRQRQVFFLLRRDAPTIDMSGLRADEVGVMDRFAWWSAEELRATREVYYPVELPDVLDGLPCSPH